jgi:uncharacterized protein with PQ loop repeat
VLASPDKSLYHATMPKRHYRKSQRVARRATHDKNHNGVDDRLDTITNICAVVLPFTTIDQLHLVYVQKKIDGVSAPTWFLYGILSIPLLMYSIKRKDTPMVVLNGLWVFIDLAVWLGVVLHKG